MSLVISGRLSSTHGKLQCLLFDGVDTAASACIVYQSCLVTVSIVSYRQCLPCIVSVYQMPLWLGNIILIRYLIVQSNYYFSGQSDTWCARRPVSLPLLASFSLDSLFY